MSDAPRTDAAEIKIQCCFKETGTGQVPIAECRKIERALMECQDASKHYRANIERLKRELAIANARAFQLEQCREKYATALAANNDLICKYRKALEEAGICLFADRQVHSLPRTFEVIKADILIHEALDSTRADFLKIGSDFLDLGQ